MSLLQCVSKKCDEESLKLVAIHQINKESGIYSACGSLRHNLRTFRSPRTPG
jgi:hypothetical protein